MMVPASLVGVDAEIIPSKVSAAIKDIESSLLTLNSQVTDASLLLTKLAESNEALTNELKAHRNWIFALSILTGTSIAFAFASMLLS